MLQFVLFIHRQAGGKGHHLKDLILRDFSDIPQELCSGIDSFRNRLKHLSPYGRKTLYIILADTETRLHRLCGLHEYLEDKRMVLILPNNHADTVSRGLQLRPRFLTTDGDLEDLPAVLCKMIPPGEPASREIRTAP